MLVTPQSVESFVRREAGGKGYNLYRMGRLGLPVPEWVALGRGVFERFAAGGLRDRIEGLVATLAPEEAAARIEEAILAEPLPAEVADEAAQAWARVSDGGAISVRSSAADEDGAAHSFAGQLSSFLYVTSPEDAGLCLRRCWASAFSARALAYRRERGLPARGVGIAAIFQRMVDPKVSGVLFTCDPAAKDPSRYVVSAVYGAGEGLVSGALDADTTWLDAATGAPARRVIALKTEQFRRGPSGECAREAVDPDRREQPCLDDARLAELYRLGRTLHDYFGRPQDIEWALAGGRLYLLQTRPVTTIEESTEGYPNLWDNSNIVESYGGLTLPLSFSFALRNYRGVYVQFCEVLGVPREVIKDMEPTLAHMLGCVNGRVFYNLYNWYKLVGVLPGFRRNREFMETMMGVRESLAPEIADRIRPHPSWSTLAGRWRRLVTGLSFLLHHFRIQRLVDRFLRDFDREYREFRHRPYDRMRSDEILNAYLEMERRMMSRWKAPIINDFLVMVHFGLFRKLTARWLGDSDPNLQNDLLAGEGHMESAEPTRRLIALAGCAAAQPELRALIERTPEADLLEALNQSEFKEFLGEAQEYLDRFGFRCMNEMKLEETDLFTDPSFFFACLKNYLRSGTTDLAALDRRRGELRERAEALAAGRLAGWRLRLYRWSMKHARKAVRNRENTRFARTRVYGVARTMFQAMGEDLCGQGLLDRPRDIFYLEVDELAGLHLGTLTAYDLKALVALRKKAYAEFAAAEPKTRFQTRGPVYRHNRFLAEPEAPDRPADGSADLRGLPCCPGVVEGVVKVVQAPGDDLKLDGEILVAPRTDPGWVPLYPSVSGLLVERGSLLSHSAIVAREMGLPAIVAIRGLTATLTSGMRVRMDGQAGVITILGKEGGHAGA